jgi:AraC-like DNA-binding protein
MHQTSSWLADISTMPSKAILLSNYPAIHTSDPEDARARVKAVFGATSFEVSRRETRFEARANFLQVGDLKLYYCAFAGNVSIGFSEVPFIRQIFNINGRMRYSGRDVAGEVAPGSSTGVLPAGVPLRFDFESSYRHLVLRIEQKALQRYLSVLLGREIDEELRFDETADQHQATKRVRRMVFQFASEFNAHGDGFSDLARAEMTRIVIMRFLMYHRHNYSHFLFREPPQGNTTAVRVVEEYIESNWDKPIDIEAMSAIARISARSLFRQFKKDRGYSPAEFAKRIRLDRAREMLEQSGGRISVTEVALKCGFQNPGHFARDFRLAFGELPSDTLRRSSTRRQS